MRRILISGASRGIGKAIAIQLLKDGHQVSIGLRDLLKFKTDNLNTIETFGNRLFINYYDALEKGSGKEWVLNTFKEFAGLDTLIHCAGILKKTSLLFPDEDLSEVEELWKVNVLGPWLLTKEAWKYLAEDGNGRIQVLVSMSGKRSKGNLAGYSMSKFALMSLCQTMRNEGWDKGIRVTAICPGWVNTSMSAGVNEIDKSQMTQVDDIALISSTLLKLPKYSVPFEIPINCNLET